MKLMIVSFAIIGFWALGLEPAAHADIQADEKALLAACIEDGGNQERCSCYLGVIKAESGAENYERAIALALAGARGDPREVVEVRRRFELSEQDLSALVRTMQAAAQRAGQICEPLPKPGGN